MHKLDLEEAAVVCFAMYSGQYKLESEKHWFEIVNVLERHDGPMPPIALGIFAKYLRYLAPRRKEESRPMEK